MAQGGADRYRLSSRGPGAKSAAGPRAGARTNLRFLSGSTPRGTGLRAGRRHSGPSTACAS